MVDLTGDLFASDDGAVPPEVATVLAAHDSGRAGIGDVVSCLVGHRVLVPLLEVDGRLLDDDAGDPCVGSDRAVAAVSWAGRDGRPEGLAFTGTLPMARWNEAARPLPVPAMRAAEAVLGEGGRTLVVDPGSAHSVRIRGAALIRLASGDSWPEPWADPAVRGAVVHELEPVLASGEIRVRLSGPPDGNGAGLVVGVTFAEGLSGHTVAQRASVLARRLSRSDALREVFDGVLAVRIL